VKKIIFVLLAFMVVTAAPLTHASQGMEKATPGMQPPEELARFFLQDLSPNRELQRAGQRAVEFAPGRPYPACQGSASLDPRRSVGT
jgi:hypothetical protein